MLEKESEASLLSVWSLSDRFFIGSGFTGITGFGNAFFCSKSMRYFYICSRLFNLASVLFNVFREKQISDLP